MAKNRQLRRYFEIISLRERFLVAAFLWICAIFWLFSSIRQARAVYYDYTAIKQTYKEQKNTIADKSLIEEEAELALSRVDESKTYSSTKLVGILSRTARKYDLELDTGRSAQTVEGEMFDRHTIRARLQKAEIKDLIAFAEGLKELAPYIGLEEVEITPDKNPEFLQLTLRVSSFELNQDNL